MAYSRAPPAALPPTQVERQGHETLQHHKERVHSEGKTEEQILRAEGADLPHDTKAGHVKLPGPGH